VWQGLGLSQHTCGACEMGELLGGWGLNGGERERECGAYHDFDICLLRYTMM